MVGVASYRQTCFSKIMALENSFLANQVRQHLEQTWVNALELEIEIDYGTYFHTEYQQTPFWIVSDYFCVFAYVFPLQSKAKLQ